MKKLLLAGMILFSSLSFAGNELTDEELVKCDVVADFGRQVQATRYLEGVELWDMYYKRGEDLSNQFSETMTPNDMWYAIKVIYAKFNRYETPMEVHKIIYLVCAKSTYDKRMLELDV